MSGVLHSLRRLPFPNEVDANLPEDSIWYQRDGALSHETAPVWSYLEDICTLKQIDRITIAHN